MLNVGFGWTLNSVATTFSITSFSLSLSALVAGKLEEKWGIRKLVLFSGIVLGAGLMLTSQVSSLLSLYLLAGVLVGFSDGAAYITSLSNIIKWFPERKGVISGVSVSAYGMGSLIFKYVNGALISSVGVLKAFLYWGIITTLMVVLGSLLLHDAVTTQKHGNEIAEYKQDYTVKEMLHTNQAYMLFAMFFTACMSGLYLISIARDAGVKMAGLAPAMAANAVSMIAIFNTIGRLILGALSDKVGRLKVVSFTFMVTALAVLVLSFAHLNFAIFFVCVASIAFCFGGNITVFPAIVGDFFGMKNHSKNYGIVYQGFGLGALAGSLVASLTGGFRPTFLVISAMCILSFLISIVIKDPNKSPGQGGLRIKKAQPAKGRGT